MIPQAMQEFQFGAVVRLIVQFIDPIATAANNNVPVPLDIAGATDLLVCLLYPDTTTSQNFAGTFLTDGTDGQIYYDTIYNTEERRDDWRHGVDENLVLLNSAQRSTDKELDELDLLAQKHERIILGDPENNKIGISAQTDSLETLVNELRAEIRSLRATLYGDHTGHPGLEGRVDTLEDKRSAKERREGWAWDSFTKITVELLLVIAMLLLNWERIEDLIKSKIHPSPPVAAQKVRRRKKPKPIVVPEINGEPAAENVP